MGFTIVKFSFAALWIIWSTALYALDVFANIPDWRVGIGDVDSGASDVDAVFAEHRQAVFGSLDPADFRAMELRGRLVVGDVELPVLVRTMRPNFTRADVSLPNGVMVQAFDGIAGWAIDPGQSPRWMDKNEAASMRRDARVFSYLIDRPASSGSIRISSTDPNLIEVTTDFGNLISYRLDPESKLVLVERKADFIEGKFRFKEIQLDDYREVSGIQVPFRIRHYLYGQLEMELLVDEVAFPEKFSDMIFQAPLVDKPRGYQEAVEALGSE